MRLDRTRGLGAGSVVLFLLGLAIGLPFLPLGFTAVDTLPLLASSDVHSWKDFAGLFHSLHLGGRQLNADFYRPLVAVSIALDHALFGLHAWGYHLTDLFLHSANAVLLFLWLSFFTKHTGATGIRDLAFPFLAAVLFLIHPAHSEILVAIDRRSDPMSLFFVLIACLLLQLHLGSRHGRLQLLILSAVSLLLALLCKETAILAVPLLLGLHLAGRPGVAERNPGFAFVYVSALLVYLALRHTTPGAQGILGGYHEPALPHLTALFEALRGTMQTWLFPWLSPADTARSVAELPGLLSLILLATLAVRGILLLRRLRIRSWRLLAFLLLLIPVSQILFLAVAGRLMLPRYFYFEAIPFSILSAGLFARFVLPGQNRTGTFAAPVLAAALVLLSVTGAILRTPAVLAEWRHASALLEQALPLDPLATVKGLEDLPEGTTLLVVNAPYCSGKGCTEPAAPVLFERTIQAWLDLRHPAKHFEAAVLNYLKLPTFSPRPSTRFDVSGRTLAIALEGAQSLPMPWEPSNLTNHRHLGQTHPGLVRSEPAPEGIRLLLSPEALQRSAFLVYRLGRPALLPADRSWLVQ